MDKFSKILDSHAIQRSSNKMEFTRLNFSNSGIIPLEIRGIKIQSGKVGRRGPPCLNNGHVGQNDVQFKASEAPLAKSGV